MLLPVWASTQQPSSEPGRTRRAEAPDPHAESGPRKDTERAEPSFGSGVFSHSQDGYVYLVVLRRGLARVATSDRNIMVCEVQRGRNGEQARTVVVSALPRQLSLNLRPRRECKHTHNVTGLGSSEHSGTHPFGMGA